MMYQVSLSQTETGWELDPTKYPMIEDAVAAAVDNLADGIDESCVLRATDLTPVYTFTELWYARSVLNGMEVEPDDVG